MQNFASHAKRCNQCARPYETFVGHGTLCEKGIDVCQYVYNRNGNACSVVDSEGNQRMQVELYEEDPPLPKAMIAKLVTHNEDKPSYEAAMAGPEAPQWRQGVKEELNRILELGVWDLVPRPAKGVKIFTSK